MGKILFIACSYDTFQHELEKDIAIVFSYLLIFCLSAYIFYNRKVSFYGAGVDLKNC